MEVRFLTEATSAEDTDWLYIQKPNGLSRKIKKINLVPQVQQLAQQIVTSATPPSNPQIGMIWNEINSSENIVEQWNWINGKWLSNEKKFVNSNTSALITNSTFGMFHLNLKHNYLIKQVDFLFAPNGNFTTSNYYVLQLYQGRNNRVIVKNVLAPVTFNNHVSTVIYSYSYPLNIECVPILQGQSGLSFNDGINSSQGFVWAIDKIGTSGVGMIYSLEVVHRLIRR